MTPAGRDLEETAETMAAACQLFSLSPERIPGVAVRDDARFVAPLEGICCHSSPRSLTPLPHSLSLSNSLECHCAFGSPSWDLNTQHQRAWVDV